jgi:hypothetical protein
MIRLSIARNLLKWKMFATWRFSYAKTHVFDLARMTCGVELYQRLLCVSHASFKESMPAPVLVLIICWMEVEKMHFGQHIVCLLQACFCMHLLDSLRLRLTNGAWKTGFPMSTMGTGSGDKCKEEVQQMLTPLKQGARKNGGMANSTTTSSHCIDGNRQATLGYTSFLCPFAIMLLDCKTGMKILILTMRKWLMDRPVWCTNPWVHSWRMFVWKKWLMKLVNVTIDGPQWKEQGDDPHLRSRLFWQWVGCADHSSTFGTCIRPSWGAV